MTLHLLIPFIIDRQGLTYAQLIDRIDSEPRWYAQTLSLVTGGGSRQLVEAAVSKMIIIDGDVWSDEEVEQFATSRLLGHHVLELSEEVGNAIEARIKSSSVSLSFEEPDDI